MSIIQEALRKIDPPDRTRRPAPPPATPAAGPAPAAVDAAAPVRPAARTLPPASARTAARAFPAGVPGTVVWTFAACALVAAVIAAILFARFAAQGAARAIERPPDRPAVTAEEPAAAPAHQETTYKTIEQPPAETAIRAAPAVSAAPPDLILNGIMYLEAGPRAIINNAIVTVGDMVGGATVTAINKKSVILAYNNVEITLNLK